jgi:hypothetical protein
MTLRAVTAATQPMSGTLPEALSEVVAAIAPELAVQGSVAVAEAALDFLAGGFGCSP